MGKKAYGHLVAERFKPEQTKLYDRILCPTLSFVRFMRQNKIRHFTHIPFSIDLNEFPKKEKKKNEKFTFLHLGGFGGVHGRKNTNAVIEAFEMMNNNNIRLVITSQKPMADKNGKELEPGQTISGNNKNIILVNKDLSRKEVQNLLYKSDCLVMPTKWETIGLPILEALACNTPVITNDVPPMNEFVRDCMNGYLCKCTMSQYPSISILGADPDIDSLRNCMTRMLHEETYNILKNNSREIIERIYDLEKNKHYFIDFLNKDLSGENDEK